MLIYNLSHDTSKYKKLNFFNVFHNDDKQLLKKLENETKEELNKLLKIDKIFLFIESHRFLFHLIFFQHFMQYDWTKYYENILHFFHKQNMLLFKQEIIFYRNYKTKKVFKTIKFICPDITFTKKYYFRFELLQDLGRDFIDKNKDDYVELYI